mmetsp:Transcript_41251/g.30329  ORF Transcript_41251/g.30329 Transcript_41251/m.30329 type:complete len:86 (+) Transcript_41251:103-360(+)
MYPSEGSKGRASQPAYVPKYSAESPKYRSSDSDMMLPLRKQRSQGEDSRTSSLSEAALNSRKYSICVKNIPDEKNNIEDLNMFFK